MKLGEKTMDSKKIFILMFSLILILTLSHISMAVSVRGPGKFFKIFEPNGHFEIEYGVISNMPPMDVVVSVVEPEEMKGSTHIDKEKFFLKYGEEKKVHVSFDLPANVITPGPHTFWFWAVESPPKLRGSQLGAFGAIKMSITIFVPYPGKYLTGQIEADPVKEGEEVVIDLILRNLGGEQINVVKAVVEIYNREGNKIKVINAYQPGNKNDFEISIGAEQTKKMYVDWMPEQGLKGRFKVKAFVNYDGTDIEIEDYVNIGYKNIEILNTTKQLESGTIAEYGVFVRSLWNEHLDSIFTEVDFFNSSGDKIDSVRSSRYDLWPFSDLWFRSYWNTKKLMPGNYSTHVKVHFEDMVVEGEYPVELVEPKSPLVERPMFTSGTILVVLLIFVILLIIGGNVFFFIFVKKKSKKEKPEQVGAKKAEKKPKGRERKLKEKEVLEKTAEEELAELEKLDLD